VLISGEIPLLGAWAYCRRCGVPHLITTAGSVLPGCAACGRMRQGGVESNQSLGSLIRRGADSKQLCATGMETVQLELMKSR
jgi:hypothetical protein